MLRLNVRYQIALRGIKNPQSYLINNGFTPGQARWLLNTNRESISLKMLKRLCAFFDCTPNDLFDWEGDDSLRLQELKKDQLLTFEVSLSGKSTKQLEELHRKLRNGEL